MPNLNLGFWRAGALFLLCGVASGCAIDPSTATPSTQSFAGEMAGTFDVAEMSDSRAGFSRLTTTFSPDGTSGTLVYDYANGTPSMYVTLQGCASYTRRIRPGFMHDDAAVEQDIHEVRCRSTGSVWRAAIFRKGVQGTRISASMKAATGYEFMFAVPFTSTVAVRPSVQ